MGEKMTLDTSRILALAAEIRRVDGGNKSGASELAERIMPFIDANLATPAQTVDVEAVRAVIATLDCVGSAGSDHYSSEYLQDAINDASDKLTKAIKAYD